MRRETTSFLDRVSWRKPPKDWGAKNPGQSLFTHKQKWEDDKTDLCRFLSETPLQSMAAGISATTSCKGHNITDLSSNNRKQEASTPPTWLKPLSSAQSSRITTSQLALPTAGRVAHCLHSWMSKPVDPGGNERVSPGIFPPSIPDISMPHGGQVAYRASGYKRRYKPYSRSKQWRRSTSA